MILCQNVSILCRFGKRSHSEGSELLFVCRLLQSRGGATRLTTPPATKGEKQKLQNTTTCQIYMEHYKGSLEVLLGGGGRWELYGSSGGWVGGSGGCYHSCRQDDDPVLGNKISQVSSRRGRGGSRRGAKAMTAGRRNRLHKEVCLQKQTGTGGNWYNTVKINQYDLLSGGRSFRGRCFESINCCLTWGALDTHLLGPGSAVWDVSDDPPLFTATRETVLELLDGGLAASVASGKLLRWPRSIGVSVSLCEMC